MDPIVVIAEDASAFISPTPSHDSVPAANGIRNGRAIAASLIT